jgi:hypothetical protein
MRCKYRCTGTPRLTLGPLPCLVPARAARGSNVGPLKGGGGKQAPLDRGLLGCWDGAALRRADVKRRSKQR